MTTKYGSKEAQKNFEDNFDKIFGQKDVLCSICGKELSKVTECAWTSCVKWLEEEKRIDAQIGGGEEV